jgi:hypothetical protein
VSQQDKFDPTASSRSNFMCLGFIVFIVFLLDRN